MVMQRGGCVYIMANAYNNVLYTGVTSDIIGRIWEHKNNVYPGGFTSRYKCYKLVYFLFYPHIEEAIAAEKLIKGGNKKQKHQLIYSLNPLWKDLYDEMLEE